MDGDDREANLEFWVGRSRTDARAASGRVRRSFGGSSGRWRSLRLPRVRLPRLRRPAFTRRSFARPSFARPAFARPSFTRRAEEREADPRRGRARPVAAATLLAGLAGAWLLVGHRSHASAEADPTAAPRVPASVVIGTAPETGSSAPAATARTGSPSTTRAPRTPACHGLSAARPALRCVIDGVELDLRLYAPGTAAEAYTRAAGAVARPGAGSPVCARGGPDERSWSDASAPAVAIGRYRCRLEQGRAAMWWTRGDRLAHALGPNGDLAALFTWWRAHPAE
ncbi:MAG: hypothetical protein JWM72_4147 [Actinomycetia bacterium]|nr:hypothetical protein [Actinomycetes bacterium]